MFEQLIGMLLGFTPTLCNLTQGKSCGRLPGIMPNGDMYACDLDIGQGDFKLGSILKDNLQHICSPEKFDQLYEVIQNGCKIRGCYQCDLYSYCGFTCPRYTFSKRECSDYYHMTKQIIKHAKQQLNNVSNKIFMEQIDFIDNIKTNA